MTKNQLSIRLYGEPVGILEQNQTGRMEFRYFPTTKTAISLGMPIHQEAYSYIQCEAFFGGLLPESETVKKIIGKRYGVSYNNSFSLLRAIGYDCAGAISCHEMDDPILSRHSFPLTGKIITDDELYQHIKILPQNPLFMDVEGLRLSLAGVQDKAAICLIDNKIALSEQGCPTTHIVKPESRYFEGLVENELFCLKIAKDIGLPVPSVEFRKIKDIRFLLVERYDRRVKNNAVERIHQEDFCQALGVISAKKYQNEGGPGFKDCFELLKNSAQPAIDRTHLASILAFNFLMGNMDAHAKNFSLLHLGHDNIRLAPFYDLICTQAYENLSQKLAMKIGSKYDINQVLPRHWEALSKEIECAYPALRKLVIKQGEAILKSIEKNRLYFYETTDRAAIIEKIIQISQKSIERTLNQFVNSKDL